jgi:hypothetical protein
MLLGVITALILALPLAAQNYDPSVLGAAPTLSSNTKTATATIFTTDVDNYINYHKYSGVLKGEATWFGFITGEPYTVNSPNNTGKLRAGYARNLGSLYLGVFYQGNIFQNTGSPDKTVTLTPDWDNANQKLKSTVQETTYGSGWNNFTNQIEFLIGIGNNLGIKVGFLESLYSSEHDANPSRPETITDYQNGTVRYDGVADEYTKKGGTLKPYLGVGATMELGDAKLMPYLDLSADIFSETLVDNYRSYTNYNGVAQNVMATVGAGSDTGYLRPVGKIGAKLDLPKKETVQTTLELNYKFDMTMYSSDYEATGFSGSTVDGTVSWADGGYVNRKTTYLDRTVTATYMDLTIEEREPDISHSGAFIYKITGEPAEGLRLGFSAGIPVSYGYGSGNGYNDQHTITKTVNNDGTSTTYTKLSHSNWWSYEYTYLNAQLDLNIGISYKLIPDRFTVNAGIKATPTAFSHNESTPPSRSINNITTEKTVDGLGNVIQDEVTVTPTNSQEKVETTDTWAGYSGTITGGFLFNFTPAVALDLGLSAATNSFTIDLASVKVLLSVKF